jgi:hypothetical protein
MNAILLHMDSPSDNVRIACVWTIINLIITEETVDAKGTLLKVKADIAECLNRANILTNLGVFDRLVNLKENDSSLDVKERAKSALAHLEGLRL